VLEHLRDLGPFFEEARRVLRPGGRGVVSEMHPAMFLREVQARFTDPATGETVQPGSFRHSIGEFVMAVLKAGFRLDGIEEQAPDAELAARFPRAERYIGWPMLLLLRMTTTDRLGGDEGIAG
jgi:malonyl-CoA O-methyltransferase